MNTDIESLISDLNHETGLSFTLTDCDDSQRTARVLTKLIHRYRGERNDGFFLKQYLLGEVPDEDVEEKAMLYHYNVSSYWTVFLLSFRQPYEPYMLQLISSLYTPGADHSVEMDPKHLVLVRQLKKETSDEEIRSMAQIMVDMLGSEAMITVKAAYDTCLSDFRQIPQSYRNVCSADSIGHLFNDSDQVYGYHELGLGKLICSLSKEACSEFIHDHLGDFDLAEIDPETQNTIRVFFDSGLSLAETARKLYVHRNTLVYRIEKLEKVCGLDIRKFDDAMIMKISLMMYDYIHSK